METLLGFYFTVENLKTVVVSSVCPTFNSVVGKLG
jgi:hypothetical protein